MKLTFLISQPRAGSTLLQRILGGHCDIHTVSEPWVMLPAVYALRKEGHYAEYNTRWAHTAIHSFISELPEGEETYYEGMRRMYGFLYEKALLESGKKVFLDKTPRYYLIIEELARIFDQAKFILLLRHPLSVLNSIIETWVKSDWKRMGDYRADLMEAPGLLAAARLSLGDRHICLRYEDLVDNPRHSVGEVLSFMGLQLQEDILHYGRSRKPSWVYGDPVGIHQHEQPVKQKLKWIEAAKQPKLWRLFHDYTHSLGPKVFQEMGYDYDTCLEQLEAAKPRKHVYARTVPLTWMLSGEDALPHQRLLVRLLSGT